MVGHDQRTLIWERKLKKKESSRQLYRVPNHINSSNLHGHGQNFVNRYHSSRNHNLNPFNYTKKQIKNSKNFTTWQRNWS